MDGILIVNKPRDWTSFDVVAKIRNLSKVKKVGHSGTLDPMATGVLPVFLGRAAKSIQYFIGGDKGYIAEMTLGIRTDTGDATGKIIDQPSPPIPLSLRERGREFSGAFGEGERGGEGIERLLEIFKKFLGEIEQVPPMYSAVKVAGKRLYKLARQGMVVKRQPRKVTIHSIRLINYENGEHPRVTFEVRCSKGTYIRQLVADMGDDLGCGAHLSKLMRTYAHPFHITQALNMDTIITLATVRRLETVIIPVESILSGQRTG